MEHGSLQNHLAASRTAWRMPVVGEGATRISWTDRDPYTVVRVSKGGKTCWVKADTYVRTDDLGMTDCGQRWLGAGSTYVIGKREKYHDFSF